MISRKVRELAEYGIDTAITVGDAVKAFEENGFSAPNRYNLAKQGKYVPYFQTGTNIIGRKGRGERQVY